MRRRTKVIIAAVSVVVALFIAWQAAAAASAHAIVIKTDAEPFHCAGHDVTIQDFDGRYVAMARLTTTIDCTLRIRVYNDGVFPVDVSSARFDSLGRTSPVAWANRIDGMVSLSRNGGEDAWAPLQSGGELDPGATMVFTTHITRAPKTCMSEGGSMLDQGDPSIGLSALGVPESRTPTAVDFGFLATSTSSDTSCP